MPSLGYCPVQVDGKKPVSKHDEPVSQLSMQDTMHMLPVSGKFCFALPIAKNRCACPPGPIQLCNQVNP